MEPQPKTNFLFSLILGLEKGFYSVRDAFWSVPDVLEEDKLKSSKYYKGYIASIPYSHFALGTVILLVLSFGLFVTGFPKITGSVNGVLREAVVMGTDGFGEVQKINKVNPILPSNVQLEKDLSNLIYEPLFKFSYVTKQDDQTKVGGVIKVLVEDIITFKAGADYQFNLRKDVTWHDDNLATPRPFTADDVVATFDLIKNLDDSSLDLSNTNAYTRALKELQWQKLDEYTVRVCTIPAEEVVAGCDERNDNPIFSNFLELISFKIVPSHLLSDINSQTIITSEPFLFRSPVGTGRYRFVSATNGGVTLELNRNHYLLKITSVNPPISRINFVYYKTNDDAAEGLKNGEVHSFATLATKYVNEFKDYNQIAALKSPVLYNQFWSLYFNLRTTPDGEPIGPEFLQDRRVRRAIYLAIDKDRIINESLNGLGEEAFSSIPAISYFFNPAAIAYSAQARAAVQRLDTMRNDDGGDLWNFDPNASLEENKEKIYQLVSREAKPQIETNFGTHSRSSAEALLERAGWTIKPGATFRTNEHGEILQFTLYFVENPDRRSVAERIKSDLRAVGIDVIIDRERSIGWSLKDLNEQILSPRLFDAVLYGMNTFVDPDRYELYHSSQIDYPGLNIAGYKGSVESVAIRADRQEGESSLVRVPKVDRLLDEARSFDPETNREVRKNNYLELQELIADDTPVAYLYHPQFVYFINKRVRQINFPETLSLEERFDTIWLWEI